MSRDCCVALPRGAWVCLQVVIVVFPGHTYYFFDYHLSPKWRQMAIENIFDPRSSSVKSVFDCRIPGVLTVNHVYDYKFVYHS